ncbi:MAG: flavodoxin family protein [Kiritimatiellaeota bacterium]|nr:flavodoxin family protein [Kiritimatiellota bacterium]
MSNPVRIVGISGSYRPGRIVDSAVSAVLDAARETGAETELVCLRDVPIKFCTNCRVCMTQPGPERGQCVLNDGLEALLQKIEAADALVLGAPVNVFAVTAVTQRFMERCVGSASWPWGTWAPKFRSRRRDKKTILVLASGAPGVIGRVAYSAHGALRRLARLLGGRVKGCLWVGMVNRQDMTLSPKDLRRANRLARRLI